MELLSGVYDRDSGGQLAACPSQVHGSWRRASDTLQDNCDCVTTKPRVWSRSDSRWLHQYPHFPGLFCQVTQVSSLSEPALCPARYPWGFKSWHMALEESTVHTGPCSATTTQSATWATLGTVHSTTVDGPRNRRTSRHAVWKSFPFLGGWWVHACCWEEWLSELPGRVQAPSTRPACSTWARTPGTAVAVYHQSAQVSKPSLAAQWPAEIYNHPRLSVTQEVLFNFPSGSGHPIFPRQTPTLTQMSLCVARLKRDK